MGSTAITNALVTVLDGDAALAALAPDGVFFGSAPPHASRFVLVSLTHGVTTWEFTRRAIEEKYYAVTAVMRKENGVDLSTAQDAAARIETVLDGARLIVSGYEPMGVFFEEPIERDPDVDDSDDSIRWYAEGGIYRVFMSCN